MSLVCLLISLEIEEMPMARRKTNDTDIQKAESFVLTFVCILSKQGLLLSLNAHNIWCNTHGDGDPVHPQNVYSTINGSIHFHTPPLKCISTDLEGLPIWGTKPVSIPI